MKKYKLIKAYPNSPKLGTIITSSNGFKYTFETANEYPEFWEEVVEKDYEILSFFNIITKVLIEIHDNKQYAYKRAANYKNVGVLTEDDCLSNKNIKIHQIKRLSDGEIFTIDDVCNYGTIKSFSINSKDNRATVNYYSGRLFSYLDCKGVQLQKIKPIFKTHDGIDVFPGENAYSVNRNDLSTEYGGLYPKNFIPNHDYIYFSTKEKAEEYVLLNNKTLSINDVLKFSNNKTLKRKLINYLTKNNNGK